MPSNKKLLQAAAGNAGESLYVEDVFSTYLYAGNGASQTITNGIDLAGEGGLVWIKGRDDGAHSHCLYDTERGVTKQLNTNYSSAETITSSDISRDFSSFNSNGFSLGEPWNTGNINSSAMTKIASWTFRKAEKFFDIQTWTGDGTGARTISHSLNGTVGSLILKRTDNSSSWSVYHKSLGVSQTLLLENTTGSFGASGRFGSSAPTTNTFDINDIYNVSGATYVAYLFASDAGGFGDDGSESIIKCGSFAHNFSGATVNCGFEPQWILVKAADQANNWYIFDVMRGIVTGGLSGDGDAALFPNTSGAENVNTWGIDVNATGFTVYGNNILSSGNAIYIAIRRPMKTPESGTEVFAPQLGTGSGAPRFVSNFATDLLIKTYRYGYLGSLFGSRLTGSQYMSSASTSAEASDSAFFKFDYQNGTSTSGDANDIGWMFKRATGFMDAVAYSGTSSAHNEEHNLNVVPELMIFKNRSQSGDNWVVYSNVFSPANYIKLNSDSYAVPDASNLRFNNTAPTESVFTVGTSIETNFNGQNYISYLFATLAGVSKVGSYTGTGADLNVDCGFSAGARFVLIKRSDSGGTGDFYVWDSARGIVAGNDPYLLLNSTAAEVTSTDYIDPLSSGFTVTSSAPAALNASGGTYIFLAIA